MKRLRTVAPVAGIARPGLARLGLARLGLARLGLARFDLTRFGLARFGLTRFGLTRFGLAWIGLAWVGLAGPGWAQEDANGDDVADLRQQIEQLRTDYEARIRVLESRVEELEAESTASPEPTPEPADPVAALREAAQAAALVDSATETASSGAEVAARGRERDLSAFNPEISFTGDFVAAVESGHQDFEVREFELDFQAALDPFSSTKFTLAYSDEEGVEIEEGYIRYAGLAPGLELRLGKMRQTFGALNRTHLHALPQFDYPLVLKTFFDEEGLAQTGVSGAWLLPRGWATANEVTLQITDGSVGPFGGEDFEDLALLGHLKSFWDLSDASYLEWGLSGIVGSPEDGRKTKVWGTDLTFHWQPPARAKYREFTWRTELLLSQRDDPAGDAQEALGGYSYAEGLLRRNLHAGLRYDWVEDPDTPEVRQWAWEPYLTWWQSEYVRLRASYQVLHLDVRDETDQRFTLQLTWAAGPHKHEAY